MAAHSSLPTFPTFRIGASASPILLLLLGWLMVVSSVRAATLIEATVEGRDVRMVIDRQQDRVSMRAAGARTLFDLAAGYVYVENGHAPARRMAARFRPGYREPAPYRIEPFGPGPLIAGHASVYHVLYAEDRVCAEVMLSAWMSPFVDPAVRAIGLLEQSRPANGVDACARIPFTTLAAAGWPLLVGKIDRPTFATRVVRFDHEPAADELVPPKAFVDVAPGSLDPFPLWPR